MTIRRVPSPNRDHYPPLNHRLRGTYQLESHRKSARAAPGAPALSVNVYSYLAFAVANRLLTSAQFTTFHQAAR